MTDTVPVHFHNGTDSNQLTFSEAIIGAPQAAIAKVTGTAGITYTSNEQAIINAQTVAINAIIDTMRFYKIITT